MTQIDVNAFGQFISQSVGCAHFDNIDSARLVFKYHCPLGFEVYSIVPARTNRKPYCRWIVTYRFTDNRPYLSATSAEQAMDTLLIYQPTNAYTFTKSICEGSRDVPASWKIEYGVQCTCQKPLTQSLSDVLDEYDQDVLFEKE